MASSPINVAIAPEAAAHPVPATGGLLVSLAPLSPQALEATLTNLALAFPDSASTSASRNILVATPDAAHPAVAGRTFAGLHLVPYTPASPTVAAFYLTASDYLNTFRIAQEQQATACLLLGPECDTLSPNSLRALAAEVLSSAPAADLAVPRYRISSHDSLVNSAILFPVTRALYGARPRFPLALDLGLSMRMAERLAAAAQSFLATGQDDAILWPVAEAATANWTITEVDGGTRILPQPISADLNSVLSQIASSLFNDINTKAAFWQRGRVVQSPRPIAVIPTQSSSDAWPDITPMLDAFRLAYTNLAEIWSLVLPPNTLLGLKHLTLMSPTAFRMSDTLWARIVYDFTLAYRLRTINRGHLLGALTPLYLAWVASHIQLANSGTPPEQHIEELATAFENDKAYLVSRWRWPDRFTP
jgi:glucosylglycerate synthase